MKKSVIYLTLAGLLFVADSCSHHNASAPGNGCISRYYPPTGPLVTAGQLDTLDLFFHKNSLSTANLQFLYVNYNNYPNSSYGTYKGPFYQAGAELILNGLRASPSNMTFTFDSTGTLLDSLGGWSGQLPNNDTTGHQSLASLRQSFLDNYKQCELGGGCLNCGIKQPTAPYQDTCLIAQLVYLDAGIQNSSIPYGQQLIKAWLVASADYPYFPEVTVIDNTGQAIPLKLFFP